MKSGAKSLNAILALIIVAGLACLILIPAHVVGAAAFVVAVVIALLLRNKMKSYGLSGNVDKAFLKQLTMTGKEEYKNYDPDGNGNVYSTSYFLNFGDGISAEVSLDEYNAAVEGNRYYVAFFPGNNNPFACFSADQYEPDADLSAWAYPCGS